MFELLKPLSVPREGSGMLQRIRQTIRDDKGMAALEYALIAGLIFSAILNASLALSPKLKSAYSNLGTSLTKHAAGT